MSSYIQETYSSPHLDDPEITMLADGDLLIYRPDNHVLLAGQTLDFLSGKSERPSYLFMEKLSLEPDVYHSSYTIAEDLYGGQPNAQVIRRIPTMVHALRTRLGDIYGHKDTGILATRTPYGLAGRSSIKNLSEPLINPFGEKLIFADKRITVDTSLGTVRADSNNQMSLSPITLEIATLIAENAGLHVKLSLLRDIFPNDAYLRVGMHTLRSYFGTELGHPRSGAIQTVQNVGYNVRK